MFKRVKYVSHFARPMTAEDIDELAAECERNNLESGVTGVLMTSGGLFFQIIEGPEKTVDELYEMISKDPRHKDIQMLSEEDGVKRRLFPDWAMKIISLEASKEERLAPLHALLETVVTQKRLIDNLLHTLERSLWQELTHGSARSEPQRAIEV